jgi:hypothetical protein
MYISFKNWLIIEEDSSELQFTPHHLETSSLNKVGFLYCANHEFYFNSTHDAACNDIPEDKKKEWGINYCDGNRDGVNAKCLAGRVGINLSKEVAYSALANLVFQTKAKQIKAKTGEDVDWLDLKNDYRDRIFKGDLSYLMPDNKNYLIDPDTKEDMLTTTGLREKYKNLLGTTIISFWNDPSNPKGQAALYAELLKPCLEKILNSISIKYKSMSYFPENDRVFVSIPHQPLRSIDYYIKNGWVGGGSMPTKLSQLEQEEMAAIHTGNLRGRYLSTDERNVLRAKYGMEAPTTNATPSDNYEKWKRQIGD